MKVFEEVTVTKYKMNVMSKTKRREDFLKLLYLATDNEPLARTPHRNETAALMISLLENTEHNGQ